MPRWLDRVAALGVPWATLAGDLTAIRAASGRPVRPADLVVILRDLPHAEPSRTDTANTLAEWCATGWLKHRLLVAAMNAAGLSARLLMASYRFDSSVTWLPSSVRAPDVLDVWSFALVDFGAGDVIEVQRPQGRQTFMVPFAESFVPALDVDAGFIVIDAPADWIEAAPEKVRRDDGNDDGDNDGA